MFNCSNHSVHSWVAILDLQEYILLPKNGSSGPELELLNDLRNRYPQYTFESHNRKILDGRELDTYCLELKIVIEFNGNYWHSFEIGTPKDYHQKKSLEYIKRGIRLLHIYEYEWGDLVRKKEIEEFLSRAFNPTQKNIKESFSKRCNLNLPDRLLDLEGISNGKLIRPRKHLAEGYTIYDAGFLEVKKRGSF